MKLTRREFGKNLSAFWLFLAAAGSAVWTAGCNLFNDILNWVPVGEAAMNSIISVLTANGIAITPALQAIIGLIEAGFNALSAAVREYQSTTPPPAGALAKIETAFKDIVDNFTGFLKSLSISGPLVAVVVGLAQVVLSTIAAFTNKLPAASRARLSVAASSVTVGGSTAVVMPKERSRRAFKKDWNSSLDDGKKLGVAVPPQAYMYVGFFEHL